MDKTQAPVAFHESFGDVTRGQLATYRKLNVSPSDHDQLEGAFGEDRAGIVRFVKEHSPNGYYQAPWPFPARNQDRRS